MASQLFREESKLKGLSGVKTEQGRAGPNVREIKQQKAARMRLGTGRVGWPLLFMILFGNRKKSRTVAEQGTLQQGG